MSSSSTISSRKSASSLALSKWSITTWVVWLVKAKIARMRRKRRSKASSSQSRRYCRRWTRAEEWTRWRYWVRLRPIATRASPRTELSSWAHSIWSDLIGLITSSKRQTITTLILIRQHIKRSCGRTRQSDKSSRTMNWRLRKALTRGLFGWICPGIRHRPSTFIQRIHSVLTTNSIKVSWISRCSSTEHSTSEWSSKEIHKKCSSLYAKHWLKLKLNGSLILKKWSSNAGQKSTTRSSWMMISSSRTSSGSSSWSFMFTSIS